MTFSVSSDVFTAHPDLGVGVIVATDIDNTDTHPEIASMLRDAEEGIRATLDLETFKEHPHIAALQEVHRSFGSNPNKFPPSIQALVKRILKGGELPTINPIVELYNVISLRYLVCAGAEDTDACTGDIKLAFADGTESFKLIGEEEEDPPVSGELVYKDDVGVICRKLNWREGDRTRITENTKNAVIVFEGFPPFPQEELTKALEECAALVEQYCFAKTRIQVLEKGSQECDLS